MDRSLTPVLRIEAVWLCIRCQRPLRFRLDPSEHTFRGGCACGETYVIAHEVATSGTATVTHCEKP